jgi:hypothetical protein
MKSISIGELLDLMILRYGKGNRAILLKSVYRQGKQA